MYLCIARERGLFFYFFYFYFLECQWDGETCPNSKLAFLRKGCLEHVNNSEHRIEFQVKVRKNTEFSANKE